MDLNIRNVEIGLVRKLKAEAAVTGVTLRELVIGKLSPKESNGRDRGVQNVSGGDPVLSDGGRESSAGVAVAAKGGGKKCAHGKAKGDHCWQCGGKAVIE
jgi:hypothetical protein